MWLWCQGEGRMANPVASISKHTKHEWDKSFSYHQLRRNTGCTICNNLLYQNTFLLFREMEINTRESICCICLMPIHGLTPLSYYKEQNSTYRHAQMKRAEFSMLSFTYSLEVYYFCQLLMWWYQLVRHLTRLSGGDDVCWGCCVRVYSTFRTIPTIKNILGRSFSFLQKPL